MKKLVTICLVCVLTTTAWGSYIVNFNENGVGQYYDGQIWHSLTYGFDDGDFYYDLPLTLETPGVLAIMEPGTGELSDLVGFSNENGSRLYVFSEKEEGELSPDMADVTEFPTEYPEGWIVVQMDEVGLENGVNGVTYTPQQGQPGYIGGGVTYNFISDVPEPATICILGLGALSLIRRKK